MEQKFEMRNSVAEYRDKKNNMTQQELGDLVGVSQKAISNYEDNENVPNVLIAMRISQILGADIHDLFIDVIWEREMRKG